MCKRTFIILVLPFFLVTACTDVSEEVQVENTELLEEFLIKKTELNLRYSHPPAKRRLSFNKVRMPPEQWKIEAKEKLREILKISEIDPGTVKELRKMEFQGVTINRLKSI